MKQTPLDTREKRWDHHNLVARLVPTIGVQAVNATATPLDAYREAGFISAREFKAGDRLRKAWVRAGRDPKLAIQLERHFGGHDKMSDAQASAWGYVGRMLRRLTPVEASCAWNVCCMTEPAEHWAARMGLTVNGGAKWDHCGGVKWDHLAAAGLSP